MESDFTFFKELISINCTIPSKIQFENAAEIINIYYYHLPLFVPEF